MTQFKKEGEKPETLEDWSGEDWRNITGFFDLLLKIDMRVNPRLYKKRKKHRIGRDKGV